MVDALAQGPSYVCTVWPLLPSCRPGKGEAILGSATVSTGGPGRQSDEPLPSERPLWPPDRRCKVLLTLLQRPPLMASVVIRVDPPTTAHQQVRGNVPSRAADYIADCWSRVLQLPLIRRLLLGAFIAVGGSVALPLGAEVVTLEVVRGVPGGTAVGMVGRETRLTLARPAEEAAADQSRRLGPEVFGIRSLAQATVMS
jgi:hypothetical protein